ncbi:entericidin EcnA/B family protein [Marivita sp.]|nr:entericidin EcnA/B family protein [Marivita sp.]
MPKWGLLMLLACSITACATVEGLGRDISGSARAVQGWF